MTTYADLPEEARRLDAAARIRHSPLPGGRMVWRLWGEGPALVLIHGGAGSWMHWLRSIDHFTAQGWCVIAPDLPGFGESASPGDGEGLETIAAQAAEGLRSLDPRGKLRLAGFSFGGVFAGHLAAALGPETMGNLVLCGSGGLGATRAEMPPLVKWRDLPEAEQPAAHRRNLEILMYADPARIDPDAVAIQAWNAERARGVSRAFSRSDTLLRALQAARPAVDSIWGEADAAARGLLDERAAILRSVDPTADLIRIPGAGHWVQHEQPAAFNAALDRLLAKRG